MAKPEPRSAATCILTGLALLVLMGTNIWLSMLLQGRVWSLPVLLAASLLQAVLLAVYLMNLTHAGRVAWVYMGTGVFLLIIACLSLTDYFTRTSPLEEETVGIPTP
jgi:caa(3)-type oxidase subunit IV